MEIQFGALTSINLGQYTFFLFQTVIHITVSRILCFVKILLPVEAMQAEQAHNFPGEVYSLYQAGKFLLLKDFMPEQAERTITLIQLESCLLKSISNQTRVDLACNELTQKQCKTDLCLESKIYPGANIYVLI